ncbi:hypothetical protein RHSP_37710 [Rhizobium freirei PRF 81]|uniref:Uncharacterized protein n=1 Tax=Rhizobium freirei PRF 81 TaxID=363754 RepID=N6UF89_9HYPH|nr:hypothetical protein RHSP_37710 [Rhizobium freirei PRF 81]
MNLPQFGIKGIAQPIAEQIDGHDKQAKLDDREEHDPPGTGEQELVTDADERAERGLARRHADAKEGQRRFGEDRHAEIERRRNHDRRQRVRQNVLCHDAPGGHADQPCRLYIILAGLDDRLCTHRAGILHPARQRDGKDKHGRRTDLPQAFRQHLPHDRGHQDRNEDGGDGQHDVPDAHQQIVDETTEETGNETGNQADQQRQHDGGHADDDGNARAIQDGRQHIAPLRIGAEEIRHFAAIMPDRRQFRLPHIELRAVIGILRRDQRRQQRRQDQYGEDRRAEDRRLAMGKGPPEVAAAQALEKRWVERLFLFRRFGQFHGHRAGSWFRSACSAQAGIDHRIGDVHQRVENDKDEGDDAEVGGHDRNIEEGDCLDEQHTHARPLEHRLGDQREGDQCPDIHRRHGDDRHETVAQRMTEIDAPARNAAGAGKLDVVGAQHLEHFGAHQTHDQRDLVERKRDRRQNECRTARPRQEACRPPADLHHIAAPESRQQSQGDRKAKNKQDADDEARQ